MIINILEMVAIRFICICIPVLLFTGCMRKPADKGSYQLSIKSRLLLDSLSSGSGIVQHRNTLYIISDNMNGFFEMDPTTSRYNFHPFAAGSTKIIQGKAAKEDLESAVLVNLQGTQQVIAFGSGAAPTTREKILLFPADSPRNVRMIDARPFYELIRGKLHIQTEQLNLEGCLSNADSMYLLNRGTNQSIAFSINAFEKMIASGFTLMPLLIIQQYNLPKQEGFTAAFSGACYFDESRFIFCASVEKVNNWIDDGEVAGSYIGLADFKGNILNIASLQDKDTVLKQKLESVEIKEKETDGSIQLYAIADNDDGRSTWFLVHVSPVVKRS